MDKKPQTDLKILSNEFNFARMRLKGLEGMINGLAKQARVQIPESSLMFIRVIEVNLRREYRSRKAELLGIPEYKVKIRERPEQKKNFSFFRKNITHES